MECGSSARAFSRRARVTTRLAAALPLATYFFPQLFGIPISDEQPQFGGFPRRISSAICGVVSQATLVMNRSVPALSRNTTP